MDITEAMDFRSNESSKRSYLREQVRIVDGYLIITGTGSSSEDNPMFPFGVIRFIEKPVITFGFEIISGTVTAVELPPIAWRMDSKGLYEAVQLRSIITASGAFKIHANYDLKGNSHLMYEKGDSWV